MNQDFLDFLDALLANDVRFLVVGAHAMAVHGVPRATGDIDLWVAPGAEEARKIWNALVSFGAPVQTMGLTLQDLETPDRVVQIGLPPRRIDLMTGISGVDFQQAWKRRVTYRVGTLAVPFLSREDLIANKRASGRSKDLADAEVLERRK